MKTTFLSLLFFLYSFFTYAQNDGIVTLTVSGQAKTNEEAIQVALRSAIEQSFGTFISSKTEILNDALIKDEIISITQGNIQKYDLLSSVQLPDGSWYCTLNATVSINKLISFCENKGISVEYKGNLYAQNIKIQELNKKNEAKIIDNLCLVIDQISNKGFDFTIQTKQPIAANSLPKEINWYKRNSNVKNFDFGVELLVSAKMNSNMDNITELIINTLGGVSLSSSDKVFLDESKIEYYAMDINYDVYEKKKNRTKYKGQNAKSFYLRDINSVKKIVWIFNLLIPSKTLNFSLSNGINNTSANIIIKTAYSDIYEHSNKSSYCFYKYDTDYPGYIHYFGKRVQDSQGRYSTTPVKIINNENKYSELARVGFDSDAISYKNITNNECYSYKNFESNFSGRIESKKTPLILDFTEYSRFNAEFKLTFYDLLTTDQISKISEYKVIPNLK